MAIIINIGVIKINHNGIFSNLTKFKNKIESPQKVELLSINKSLKKYPAEIDPMARTISGAIIIKGDSWVFSIGIDLLLYFPKKTLKLTESDLIRVIKNVVKEQNK